jgi:pimeloyl-ACP methyl ester carboxylesterase
MQLLESSAPVRLTDDIMGRVAPGPGEKVFWLHGYTLDSSSWGPMWSRLPHWHHIGSDFPGHGASPPADPSLNLQSLGRMLGEYCLSEGVRHVVGLSFGTVTALQIALEFPREFASITLAAPAIAGGPQDPSVQRAYMDLFISYQKGARGKDLRELWMACDAWNGVDTVLGLADSLGGVVDKHQWHELSAFSMRKLFEPAQVDSPMNTIESPVLVLVGDGEMAAFVACADQLEREVPNCARKVLPATGHLCLLQSPDIAAPLIAEHLGLHGSIGAAP